MSQPVKKTNNQRCDACCRRKRDWSCSEARFKMSHVGGVSVFTFVCSKGISGEAHRRYTM